MPEQKEINVYRAKHNDTGEIHFVICRFLEEQGQYVIERFSQPRFVAGEHYISHLYFDTFAEVARYRHYIKYGVAAQVALQRYGYSCISYSGWSEKLGVGYSPWYSIRQTRVAN